MHPKAKTILEEITSGHKKKEDIDPAHHTLEDVEDFINYDLTHDDDEVVMYSVSKSQGRVWGLLFGFRSGSGINISGIFPLGFWCFGGF